MLRKVEMLFWSLAFLTITFCCYQIALAMFIEKSNVSTEYLLGLFLLAVMAMGLPLTVKGFRQAHHSSRHLVLPE